MDVNNIDEYLQHLSDNNLSDAEFIDSALNLKFILNALDLTDIEKKECYELVIHKLIIWRPLLGPDLVSRFKDKYWWMMSAGQFHNLEDAAIIQSEADEADMLCREATTTPSIFSQPKKPSHKQLEEQRRKAITDDFEKHFPAPGVG